MKQDIQVEINRAMASAVGAENGITPAELEEIAPRVRDAHEILRRERADKVYGFYDLYKNDSMFADIAETAAQLKTRQFENLVVLGIGGSALGITALTTALKPAYYNLLTRRGRGGPRIFVMDNIDAQTFSQMQKICPPKKTLYNVISKSGSTAETVTQMMVVCDAIERTMGKEAVAERVVVTTNPRAEKPNLLHRVADTYGLKTFEIPLNVGGRFSVFSPVGMFAAEMLGMDVQAIREGCRDMDERCQSTDLKANPAYLRAAVQYLADTRKGKTMCVMMPYSDALKDVADWYRQLWAESLGKQKSLDGADVYAGQTPIKALGVTDQHSQVQLYREGPNNKIFTIVEVGRFDKTIRVPDVLSGINDLDYLRGKSMNKLMAAELQGTIDALKVSRRPVIRVTLPRVNAHTFGQLLYMLQLETAMAGRLYNVQTFDQPGVEEGKRIARELMSK
jgi:glucose-6-phosphate isomerase